MNKFSEFDIKPEQRIFEGDKIRILKILNREIIVHYFKLEDSKVYKDRGTCKCLHIQITFNNEKHIIFTSSSGLISAIQQVTEDRFPFSTIIIEENKRFKFT